ncbi:flavodoxin [Aureococcus anophagefferens]|nr:flavodoxin [Aureococcus anophagefferens]
MGTETPQKAASPETPAAKEDASLSGIVSSGGGSSMTPGGTRKMPSRRMSVTTRHANLKNRSKDQKEAWERYWAAGPFRKTADLAEGDFNVYLQLLARHRSQPSASEPPLTMGEYDHLTLLQKRIVSAGLDVVRPAEPVPLGEAEAALELVQHDLRQDARAAPAPRAPGHGGAGDHRGRAPHGEAAQGGARASAGRHGGDDVGAAGSHASKGAHGPASALGFEPEDRLGARFERAQHEAQAQTIANNSPRARRGLGEVAGGVLVTQWCGDDDDDDRSAEEATPNGRKGKKGKRTAGARAHFKGAVHATVAGSKAHKIRGSVTAVNSSVMMDLLKNKTVAELREAAQTAEERDAARAELNVALSRCKYCRNNTEFCPTCVRVANGWLTANPAEFGLIHHEISEMMKNMMAETFSHETYGAPMMNTAETVVDRRRSSVLSKSSAIKALHLEKVNSIIADQLQNDAWFEDHNRRHRRIQRRDKANVELFEDLDERISLPKQFKIEHDTLDSSNLNTKSGQLDKMADDLGGGGRPRCPWAQDPRERQRALVAIGQA